MLHLVCILHMDMYIYMQGCLTYVNEYVIKQTNQSAIQEID